MSTTAPQFKQKPEKLIKGPRSFLEKFNALCDSVTELREIFLRDRVIVGTNLQESQTSTGRKVDGSDGSSTATTNNNWRPYNTPWTGQGNAPANWGLHVSIYQSFVAGLSGPRFPSNSGIDIVVPANCTAGYYAWLVATIDPTSGDMTALAYGSGGSLPTQSAPDLLTGQLPAAVYLPLFRLTSTATGVDDFDSRFVLAPLNLKPVQVSYTGDTAVRSMEWTAITGDAVLDSDLYDLPPDTPDASS